MAKKTTTKKAGSGERRGPHRRMTTDRRRDKSRWDPKAADRRKGFGRRREDKAWERLVDEFD